MVEINEKTKRAIESIQGLISGHIKLYACNDDIVEIANQSGLTKYIPPQLVDWNINDFNYDVDVYNLLIESYINEDGKTLENFYQTLYDNIKTFQSCKRFQKDKCFIPIENHWKDAECDNCEQFLDNGLKGILAKPLMTLGFAVDDEGFVEYKKNDILDIEEIVNEIIEETSAEKTEELLPNDIILKGTEMAEVYTFLYCIENSLRMFVETVLIDEYGEDYTDNIPKEVKRKIESRKEEEKLNKWLSIRGGNDLFYTDFNELGNIITKNWTIFSKYFPRLNWIVEKINDIYRVRNLVGHNSYVKNDDRNLLRIYYIQIIKQIQN